MMKAVARAAEPADREHRIEQIRPLYLEALTLVERLHRRLLDVIKDEFDRRSRADVNAVQALLLYNIGDKELTASELRTEYKLSYWDSLIVATALRINAQVLYSEDMQDSQTIEKVTIRNPFID